MLAMIAAPARSPWAGDVENCDNLDALLKTDPDLAVSACRRLTEQGKVWAQYNLGVMYANGQDVPRDYPQAHMWFCLATAAYSPEPDRDDAVKNRDIVAAKMTAAQIKEAERLVRAWKPTQQP